jgi:hypothetical protein
MDNLNLSPEEFQEVVRVCQRVLINAGVPSRDLQNFLVSRLSNRLPQIADRIHALDGPHLEGLRRDILDAMGRNTGSALWE